MQYTGDNEIFINRIAELSIFCNNNKVPRFTSFLTESEQEAALIALKKLNGIKHLFFGGYEEAERKVLGFLPECENVFPIKAVVFKYKSFKEENLSHRDFLGALMGLGLKRDTIGDIVVSSDFSVLFCLEKVALIISELSKISNIGVKAEIKNIFEVTLPKLNFSEIDGVISGLRIDSVLSAAIRVSREKAQLLIDGGNVKIKGIEIFNHSKLLEENTSFTVKGFGKYMLSEVGSITKKNRIHIKIKKFK